MKIHPSACVSAEADIDPTVEIGPFCYIAPGATLAAGCRLLMNVTIHENTSLGEGTVVCEGAALGGLPQHLAIPEKTGSLVIGSRNMIREHVTIHRAMHAEAATTIGDQCLLMVGSHIAHDCQIGSNVILTNGVMLGGHVQVGDRACLGGNAAVHQFCRIGRLAMVGGCTKVTQDIPPFLLTDGATAMIVGLNHIGLRRAGLSREEILSLKAAYRVIYREGLTFRETLEALRQRFPMGVASEFAEFFATGRRGFVQERRSPPKVVLRVHPAVDELDSDTVEELSPNQQAA